ncbi:superoxide dismutase family protein [Gimesia sp.]|uniref:superoxide dismutase family protein n=1 Tax=Gimesia sp. TaxID=2024833 RepID=UPI003A94F8FF
MKTQVLYVLSAVIPVATSMVSAVQSDLKETDSKTTQAVAVIMPTKEFSVTGMVQLKQSKGMVHLTGKIEGLSPGKHGFHIHEFGDISAVDGSSAGGHYDPEGHQHGKPGKAEHHAGDLGNITADQNGIAVIDKRSEDFKISDVIGRSIVVHAGADDLTSQPSGDAGPRAGLGVIGIAKSEPKAKADLPARTRGSSRQKTRAF